MRISQKAFDFILSWEVSSQQQYERALIHPTWPGDFSGVTVGIGYDIGQLGKEKFKSDWTGLLPAPVVGRLATSGGVTGLQARMLVASGQFTDIVVPWDAAEIVFRTKTIPEVEAQVLAALSNTDWLSGDSFGALVSLTYNRGSGGFLHDGTRYSEMRAIRDLMAQRAFYAIPDQICSMKRLWTDGLRARREQEGEMFYQGLPEEWKHGPAMVPPEAPSIGPGPSPSPNPSPSPSLALSDADRLNQQELDKHES